MSSYTDYQKVSGHAYCARCGAKTVKGPEYVSHYERDTGNPVMHYEVKCPNWSFPFKMLHEKELFHGDDLISSHFY